MDSVLSKIVDYTRSRSPADVSAGALHGAKGHYLDAIGCAAGGFDSEPCRITREISASAVPDTGITVFGLSADATPEYGVFANVAALRHLDYNDTYVGRVVGGGHPSDMIPAVQAAVELTGGSGADLLFGISVGYEVFAAFADHCAMRDEGFDQGAVLGVSAAAAAGRVMGLSEQQLANAISIALVPGLPLRVVRAGDLTHWKGCATGQAAMNAIWAVRLAQAGMTAPSEPFEGVDALSRFIGPIDLGEVGEQLDGVSAIERTLIKYYPSEMSSQGPVKMAIELREQVAEADIEDLKIETYHLAWHEIGGGQGDAEAKWDPTTREGADHSLPYLVAVALTDGHIGLESFTQERISDPVLRPLMQKISVEVDPDLEPRLRRHPSEHVSRFTVSRKDGDPIVLESNFPLGHYKNPVTDEQLDEKFMRMAPKVLPEAEAEELRSLIWALDEESDLSRLRANYSRWSAR